MNLSKINIILGAGGVGKTTLSSYFALKFAKENPDKKIKLVTIDPSKRLKDLLQDKKGFENLQVSLNDREELFLEFIKEASRKKNLDADKIIKNKFFKSLVKNLAISQEFTSLYELVNAIEGEQFDCVVVDTPPLQNAAEFFTATKTIKNFFSGAVVKMFLMKEQGGYFFRMFNKVRRLSIDVVSNLTGSEFIKELSDFFVITERIQSEVIHIVNQAEEFLKEKSQLILVCNDNDLSLKGAWLGVRELQKAGFTMDSIVVNKFKGKEEGFEFNRLLANSQVWVSKSLAQEPLDIETLLREVRIEKRKFKGNSGGSI